MPRHRFTPRRCAALLLGTVLSVEPVLSLSDAEQQKKFEEVKRNIEKLKRELEKTKSSRDSLQESLENNEREIQKLDQKTQELRQGIDQKQSRIKDLQIEQAGLDQKKKAQTEQVEDYLNAAWRLGQKSQLQLLLNQQDPAQVTRMMTYYQRFSASRQEKINTFIATLQELQAVEQAVAQERVALENNYNNLKAQQKRLHGSREEREAILSKLDRDLQSQKQRLTALETDRKRLEKLLSKVYEEINAQELAINVSDFGRLKGKLPQPTKGTLRNVYGRPRSGSQLLWQGIEFSAPKGTDVVAIHHGQVVFSDYLRGHGLLLIIDHGSGYMSLYAHNDNLYKELGEWVEAGEPIASVGNTGGRRDTALYFELRHNGQPTNPTHWLKRA